MDYEQGGAELPEKTNSGVDGSIRVKSSLRISVNDSGGEIYLPVEDIQFIEDFYNMLDTFEGIAGETKEKTAGLVSGDRVRPLAEDSRRMVQEIDRVFGDGCCQKVFGRTTPSMYLIADFIDQMIPILNQYANDRQSRIADKYNRNRRGGQPRKRHHRKRS